METTTTFTWWYVKGPETDNVPSGIYYTSDESHEWADNQIPMISENTGIPQSDFSTIEVVDVVTRTETIV